MIKYIKPLIFFCFFTFIFVSNNTSQVKSPDPVLKWAIWTVLQAIPSINFYEDKNELNNHVKLGLQWQVIPVSYSFETNKYLSNFSFFYLKPVKRFSGSLEIYFQPEFIPGGFKYAELRRFMLKSGIRSIFPVAQRGEYLAFSLGAGLNNQRTANGENKSTPTLEAGVYSFFGMLGLKFNYNPNAISKYSFGLYLKYY